MAQVWRGSHSATGVPVAVKVLTALRARNPDYLRWFSAEVRAVAALDHPGVVLLLDYGRVAEDAEHTSGGGLVAGSPYLVMELASGGSLARYARGGSGSLSWPELRDVLLRLLDALGHAHARGVVHRDLKPDNVLLCTDDDLRPGLKLSDFGLAFSEEAAESGAGAAGGGTPWYMAPEQIEGRWRDYGPSTDLYGLGCLAFELACGERSCPAHSMHTALYAHMAGQQRPFAPRVEVPEGLAAWVDHLRAPEAPRRYASAADAAWALRQLPGAAPADVGSAVPPLPETWRRGTPHTPVRLLGVGLGLFGLRTMPLVGRDEARDLLWELLSDVHATRRPRLVLLEGPAGCGKSRLARWLGERAQEAGAALPLLATHGPNAGPADGLAQALARFLRCGGLPAEEVPARIRAALATHGIEEPAEVDALAELVAPSGDAVRLESPAERYLLLQRLLADLARRRPLVVWLDDVHWGLDALLFATSVLETGRHTDLPLLLVLTARPEILSEVPAAAALVALLLDEPAARRLPVGPLPEADRPALVRELLGLDGELAAQVEERTAGNPLFAIQLVGDWVQRRVLVPGGRGFTLRPGEPAPLPDDLHAVWQARVEALLAGLPPEAGATLELAACLGPSVDAEEWRGACREAGLTPPQQLADRLLARRLAQPAEDGTEAGWRFVHCMLRESLVRAARDASRWRSHNRLCAAMLRGRAGPHTAERLGRHLLEAGQPDEACAPLLAGIQERLAVDELRSAERLLDEAEGALTTAVDTDPRRGLLLLLRCQHARASHDLERARDLARATLRAIRESGWQEHLAAALLERARTSALVGGNPKRISRWLVEAQEQARSLGDIGLLGEVQRTLANHLLRLGRLDEAEQLLHDARATFSVEGNGLGEATALELLGEAAGRRGDPATAGACLEAASARYRELGSRSGLLRACLRLGDVVREWGDQDRAATLYREAADLGEAIGSGSAAFAAVNLALILVDSDRWDEARRRLEQARAEFAGQGRAPLVAAVAAFLLPCVAAHGDWQAWDDLLRQATDGLTASGFVDPDIPRAAERGAELARRAEHGPRADAALELARAQRRALGDDPGA